MRSFYFLLLFILATVVSGQITPIPAIKSANKSSQTITTTGIVTLKFVDSPVMNGFYLQDEVGDGNPNTSDAIFVFSENDKIAVGDKIEISATVSPDGSQLTLQNPSEIKLVSQNNAVTPTKIKYGTENPNLQPYRGMLVEFDQILWINDNTNLERFGELELGVKRKQIPTNSALPRSTEYTALVNENALPSIFLDDGYSTTYRTPIVFADQTGTRRKGERVNNLQGVLDYINGRYVVVPSQLPVIFFGNPRKRTHDDIGKYNLKVCGFNLEYYLTQPNTDPQSTMGPSTQVQVDRQHAKIVDALWAIDADIYGLVEIEMGQQALTKLTKALNDLSGTNRYTFINDGSNINGTFTKAAYIYRSDKVSPYKTLTNINNPSPTNRKKIQAFSLNSNNERFIYSLNHFKAKSGCPSSGPDADQRDGQGCFNATRVAEAKAVMNTLNTVKANVADDDVLIMGDLNAYGKEDPIMTFVNGGYIDMHNKLHADSAYSYVYRTEVGYLDHAIASESLSKQITGVTTFHINADELSVYGYDAAKYNVGMYRSSDHDPVIVGIALGGTAGIDVPDSNINIYPTIISDDYPSLNIELEGYSIAQIFSVSGIKLYENEINNQSINIKNIGIQQGAYIIRVLHEGKIHQQIIFVK